MCVISDLTLEHSHPYTDTKGANGGAETRKLRQLFKSRAQRLSVLLSTGSEERSTPRGQTLYP